MCETIVNRAKTICVVTGTDNELEHLRNILKKDQVIVKL